MDVGAARRADRQRGGTDGKLCYQLFDARRPGRPNTERNFFALSSPSAARRAMIWSLSDTLVPWGAFASHAAPADTDILHVRTHLSPHLCQVAISFDCAAL
ncbi:hypothetical protein JCM14124_18630 [Humidesulfovibrio idahonensis]